MALPKAKTTELNALIQMPRWARIRPNRSSVKRVTGPSSTLSAPLTRNNSGGRTRMAKISPTITTKITRSSRGAKRAIQDGALSGPDAYTLILSVT